MGRPDSEAKSGKTLHTIGRRHQGKMPSSTGQTALSILATCLCLIHTSYFIPNGGNTVASVASENTDLKPDCCSGS